MARSIPPRTMSTISRARRGSARRWVSRGSCESPGGETVAPVKPRQWRYQTRPLFKRVRGPLVDVFTEAEEVLIVIDLGGFTRGEISLSRTPERYVVEATRGEQQFSESIGLPPNADVERAEERLINGVLEIVLPRKAAPARPARRRATRGR